MNPMKAFRTQFRALGRRELPSHVALDGRTYRLLRTLKHGPVAAVGLYERDGDRVVCKFHREAPFFGIPQAWLGRLMAAYEAAVLKRLSDLDGVPAFRGRPSPGVVAREFIPGRPLERHMRVGDDFFPRLFELLAHIHARGIAYVDLEKADNILLGEDGQPYLIDFQIAFYVPRRYLGETAPFRWWRKRLQQADLYHATKHYRRIRPDRLTEEQIAWSRKKPLFVRVANIIWRPYKKLMRLMLGKGSQ